ncbi:hypothetical protein EG329_005218 [Mollisiaceae sp. DMI_Dod_QoI]|nr:hypothetical protein EG329_005218 [Helotiales sp. DMI_Dod_QoI]
MPLDQTAAPPAFEPGVDLRKLAKPGTIRAPMSHFPVPMDQTTHAPLDGFKNDRTYIEGMVTKAGSKGTHLPSALKYRPTPSSRQDDDRKSSRREQAQLLSHREPSQRRPQSREPSNVEPRTPLLQSSSKHRPKYIRLAKQECEDIERYAKEEDELLQPQTSNKSSSQPSHPSFLSTRDKSSSHQSQSQSQSQSRQSKSQSQSSHPSSTGGMTQLQSHPPPGTKSLLSSRDREMAARQTRYTILLPSEREEQETWAQTQIKRTAKCPHTWDWIRLDRERGYRCEGGHHFITDELLAEGKRGMMFIPLDLEGKWDVRWGPYYPDVDRKEGRYVYGGPKEGGRVPRDVPVAIWKDLGPEWGGPMDFSLKPLVKEVERRIRGGRVLWSESAKARGYGR